MKSGEFSTRQQLTVCPQSSYSVTLPHIDRSGISIWNAVPQIFSTFVVIPYKLWNVKAFSLMGVVCHSGFLSITILQNSVSIGPQAPEGDKIAATNQR